MKILNNVHNSVLWILKSNEKATLNLKKEAEIWHEMTVIEEMMPVYLEYGLK